MPYPRITHHGPVDTVTGSCHQLHLCDTASLLVDCGLFQGESPSGSNPRIDFPLSGIHALVLTHVHIDHVGRLSYLLAAGYRGPILCSEASAELLPLVLEDALRLTVGWDRSTIRRYIQRVQQRLVALAYDQWHPLIDSPGLGCKLRLQRAGHVLGSAYVECAITHADSGADCRVVFSGDLGAPATPLLRPPRPPERADILVLESTYGDRLHEDRLTRQARLEAALERALENQGSVLIPAFSIGRTQELLYELEDILHRRALDSGPTGVEWAHLPILLDSPLASRFTKAYRRLKRFWNEEARQRLAHGRKPLAFRQLLTIDSHADHERTVAYLARSGRPAIVIAGNGMCSSGRIVNYLRAMLGDPRHHVLFVGHQGRGTPGAAIQAGAGKADTVIDLAGESRVLRAGVSTLGGYSAHADQQGLVDFVKGIPVWPRHIHLVHGEEGAKRALRARLEQERTK
jgi:metallo-beta-lactamase family protein